MKRKPEQTLLSFFHSKPKVAKVSETNIVALENRTASMKDEEDSSFIISKILDDFIKKVCEPRVDKPNTCNRIDLIDDNKIAESSHLIFCSGFTPNIQGFFSNLHSLTQLFALQNYRSSALILQYILYLIELIQSSDFLAIAA